MKQNVSITIRSKVFISGDIYRLTSKYEKNRTQLSVITRMIQQSMVCFLQISRSQSTVKFEITLTATRFTNAQQASKRVQMSSLNFRLAIKLKIILRATERSKDPLIMKESAFQFLQLCKFSSRFAVFYYLKFLSWNKSKYWQFIF